MTSAETWQVLICLALSSVTLELASLALLRHGLGATVPWVGLAVLLAVLGFVHL